MIHIKSLKTFSRMAILLVVFFSLNVSCNKNRSAILNLHKADSIMESASDSALTILKSINVNSLNERLKSRWAYLYSKAEYKSGISGINDSILNLAYHYSLGRADSVEYQILFLKGYQQFYKSNLDSALVFLHESFDKSNENSDHYYAALNARTLAYVYNSLHMTRHELEWAMNAKKEFLYANKNLHALLMDDIIANALERNGRDEEALEWIAGVDTLTFNKYRNFRESLLKTRAKALHDLKENDNVVDTYVYLEKLGYEKDPYDCFLLSETFMSLDDLEKARRYYQKGKEMRLEKPDSLYMMKVNALISASEGNYKEAFKSAFELYLNVISLEEKRVGNPGNELLLDNYRLQNENLKISAQKNKYFIILLIVSIILFSFLISGLLFYLRWRLIKRREELNDILEETETLKKEITELQFFKESFYGKEDQAERLKSEIRYLFKNHYELIDKIFELCYRQPVPNESRITKNLISLLKEIETIEVSDRLEEIINRYEDDWMKKFRQKYPCLSPSEYQLVIYLHLGFSRESISILLGKPNLNAVSQAKYKLRKKLKLEDFSCI